MLFIKFIDIRWTEIKPLVTLIVACLLFGLLTPFGILWHFFKPFYDGIKKKKSFGKIMLTFLMYWLRLFYQFWTVIKYLMNRISVAIDIFGNVADGEFLEDTVTSAENTLFGDGTTTISASMGDLAKRLKLTTRFGRGLNNLLSKVFEPNHSINAIEKKRLIDKFNEDRRINYI
jgi:hypothetical protein